MDATYSPDDNKLRLYSETRLDSETYARVKQAGFRWAPKQDLFVAPMWTPGREDLLIELCGEIGDEDTSLTDRAEQRADRFEEYSDKRAKDAETAQAGVAAIADNIPLGQPILVGHHSEKHARKDAQRIENGMRKAVKMWETSDYWKDRAAGAIHHAKYKELPAVRARRIKKIKADGRKQERNIKEAEHNLKLWAAMDNLGQAKRRDGTPATAMDIALAITNRPSYFSACFTLADYPRDPPASQYEGSMGLWSALDGGVITAEQARDLATPANERTIKRARRWITHYENRLTYEHAMLESQGGTDLLKPKARPKQLPLCNYRAPDGIDVPNIYNRGETIHHPQVEMTKAEYSAINRDYKGAHVVGNSHRVRTTMQRHSLYCVFLTDSKTHDRPDPIEATPAPPSFPTRERTDTQWPSKPERPEVDTMKDTLKEGITVAVAPQLFPTPRDLAQRMADKADIRPGDRVLEPSAGTGMLVGAMGCRMFTDGEPGGELVAVEINHALADGLRNQFPKIHVIHDDFLNHGPIGLFDRIVMNPPFVNGADIKHIRHALTRLRPGGRLVAICANGPRQNDTLRPLCDEWRDLEPGTFKEAGTNVNAAMVVISA